MRVADYSDKRLIVFLHARTRDQVLAAIVDALHKAGKLHDRHQFLDAILEREKILATGLGMGIAVPHTKLEGYNDFFVAVGIQKEGGIHWDSLDRLPVQLVFMIGGPNGRQSDYLQILSSVVKLIKSERCRRSLLEATTADEAFELLKG